MYKVDVYFIKRFSSQRITNTKPSSDKNQFNSINFIVINTCFLLWNHVDWMLWFNECHCGVFCKRKSKFIIHTTKCSLNSIQTIIDSASFSYALFQNGICLGVTFDRMDLTKLMMDTWHLVTPFFKDKTKAFQLGKFRH